MANTKRPISSSVAVAAETAAELDRARVREVLDLASLRPGEGRFRLKSFRTTDLQPDSVFWRETFDGDVPRPLSQALDQSDLIVGATNSEFVICVREGLPAVQRWQLLRHGAGHIALGHIRIGDDYVHVDRLTQPGDGHPRRRWDSQVDLLFSEEEPEIPAFAVEGLEDAFARLVTGLVDPDWLSAAGLLRSYADEIVEVPQGLAIHARLFPHQTRGLAELSVRLRRFNAAVLADSVGLGKTRLACALVRVLKDSGHVSRAAIVTPRKLERNWRKEMAVVGLTEGEDVIILNKDGLKRLTPQETAQRLRGSSLVIVEEAHQDLRNVGNRFFRNIRDGVGLAQGLLVTATPWNNRRGDIFSILSPFVRTAPGVGGGVFECFKKGFRAGRREFEESDDVFGRVYGLTVLQRTRRQLRDLGESGVFFAPRDPRLEIVPYSPDEQRGFQKLLGVVDELRLPYFNPVRFLAGEHDSEWRLSRTHRFFLLKRAESSMAAFQITLQRMRERAEQLRRDLLAVADDDDAIAGWLAGTYRIAEEVVEAALDASLEGALLAENVSRPRQRRILRLIREAHTAGHLRPLRHRLLADAGADIRLLDEVTRDFASLFNADPKLIQVQALVRDAVRRGEKVLLVSQFADTAFTVHHALRADPAIGPQGVGLVMSTAKGGESPVQANGRPATREEVIRRFAPRAWDQTSSESGELLDANGRPVDELAVLIGTDTISVGQNLQDARVIFHLDLTWNPMILEQRIGRLDRPRHEADNAPIQIRYFLNLDLIETELALRRRLESRLEATYRDTAFDDEVFPGYFELIEAMRRLRIERADAAEIALEVDSLI